MAKDPEITVCSCGRVVVAELPCPSCGDERVRLATPESCSSESCSHLPPSYPPSPPDAESRGGGSRDGVHVGEREAIERAQRPCEECWMVIGDGSDASVHDKACSQYRSS